MTIIFSGTGTARQSGNWMRVNVDPGTVSTPDGRPTPGELARELDSRYYAVEASGRTFLLDEPALAALVNAANQFHPRVPANSDCLMHRKGSTSGIPRPLFIDVDQLLPPDYLSRLLVRPLSGEVTRISDISQREVNAAGWMRPPEYKTQYSGTIRVNLGASAGVFPGMRLYVGQPVSYDLLVQSVTADHSEGPAVWISPPPLPGMPVSSAAVQRGR